MQHMYIHEHLKYKVNQMKSLIQLKNKHPIFKDTGLMIF